MRERPELLYGEDKYIAQWVCDRIPDVDDFGFCTAIGVVFKKKPIMGMVFHEYRDKYDTIQISAASDSPIWARKEIIGALLAYPFYQLNCYRVYALISNDNTKALKACKHIGFKSEALLSSVFGKGKDGVSLRMLLPEYHGLYDNE